jgi:hypothetical protein
MVNINKLSATLLLIKGSLFPVKRVDSSFSPPENNSTTNIPLEEFSSVFIEINSLLRPDGTLALHFDGVLFPAGPFLLYRLKSYGFSSCRAVVTADGILLTARR